MGREEDEDQEHIVRHSKKQKDILWSPESEQHVPIADVVRGQTRLDGDTWTTA